MKFTYLTKADAPSMALVRKKRQYPGVDEVIAGLTPGHVARIELEEGERTRAAAEQLFQVANGQGSLLRVWEIGGVVYAELASAADPS